MLFIGERVSVSYPTTEGLQGNIWRSAPMGRQYSRHEQWGYHTEETYQAAMRLYHQQIHGIDVAVGMIMDALQAQGVAENTVVLYSSDNGFFNGSHGLGSKVLPYEEGSRVPLLIHDPRMANSRRGQRIDAVTETSISRR